LGATSTELSSKLRGHHALELYSDELLRLIGREALSSGDAVDELLLDIDPLRCFLKHSAVELEQLSVLTHL
jgi:hypothetical protein